MQKWTLGWGEDGSGGTKKRYVLGVKGKAGRTLFSALATLVWLALPIQRGFPDYVTCLTLHHTI